jgi:hypothetical protein
MRFHILPASYTPETGKALNDLAATSGCAPEDIVEDALAGYLEEVTSIRKTLDSRYDDLKTGRIQTDRWRGSLHEATRKERAPTIWRMSRQAFHRYVPHCLRTCRESPLGLGGVSRSPKSAANGSGSPG